MTDGIITSNIKNGKTVTYVQINKYKGQKTELLDILKEMKVNNKNMTILNVTLKTSQKYEHH